MGIKTDFTVAERFLRYVQIDTQSREDSPTSPSTEKQKDLAKILVADLQEIGLANAHLDSFGHVTAILPATTSRPIPTIGLLAHMDTSPEVPGADVKPQVHRQYRGGDIALPGDPSQIIRASENPDLAHHIGHDIITSDGTTLLGADDKAGIAEILEALVQLVRHPEIEHGVIRVGITPDEEVGRGTEHFDVQAFGADYAYTVDGGAAGEIEDETFCADTVVLTIHGANVHPGYAKGKLTSSIKLAAQIIDRLPREALSPETTEGREGYVHPWSITGGIEETQVKILIRDFTVEGLHEKEALLRGIAEKVVSAWPRARMDFRIEESYRNMKYKLDEEPKVVEHALEAVRRAGLKPQRTLIRGGTDGARLSYQGLLTPNIFTGGHNFHSKLEWVAIQDMEKAVETLVHLVQIWAEEGRASK